MVTTRGTRSQSTSSVRQNHAAPAPEPLPGMHKIQYNIGTADTGELRAGLRENTGANKVLTRVLLFAPR